MIKATFSGGPLDGRSKNVTEAHGIYRHTQVTDAAVSAPSRVGSVQVQVDVYRLREVDDQGIARYEWESVSATVR